MTTIDETNCFLYDDNRATWKGPTKNSVAFTDSQSAASLAAAKTAYDWTADGSDTNADSIVWAPVRKQRRTEQVPHRTLFISDKHRKFG